MKIGDLVRCKVTKDPHTVGIVINIVAEPRSIMGNRMEVMTGGQLHQWSEMRLEVINESR
jgi:hypothetical protein